MAVIENAESDGHTKDATAHPPSSPSLEAFHAISFRPEFMALLTVLPTRSTLDATEIERVVNGMRAVLAWRGRAVFDGVNAIEAVRIATHEHLAQESRRLPVPWGFTTVRAEDIQLAREAIELFRAGVNLDDDAAPLVALVGSKPATTREELAVHAAILLASPGSDLISPFPDRPLKDEPCCDACAHGTGACEIQPTALAQETDGTFALDPWESIKRLVARRATCATGTCPTS